MRFVRKLKKTMRVVVKVFGNDWEKAEDFCKNNKDCELDTNDIGEIVAVRKFEQEIWT